MDWNDLPNTYDDDDDDDCQSIFNHLSVALFQHFYVCRPKNGKTHLK